MIFSGLFSKPSGSWIYFLSCCVYMCEVSFFVLPLSFSMLCSTWLFMYIYVHVYCLDIFLSCDMFICLFVCLFVSQRRPGVVSVVSAGGGWVEGEGVEGEEGEEGSRDSRPQPACEAVAEQSDLYTAGENRGKLPCVIYKRVPQLNHYPMHCVHVVSIYIIYVYNVGCNTEESPK